MFSFRQTGGGSREEPTSGRTREDWCVVRVVRRSSIRRAPLPFPPWQIKAPPWLGELKVKGKRGIEHRLYFSEPVDTDDNRVVAVGYGRKDPRDLRGPIKQRDHIRKAMEYTRYWFRTRGYGIRPFGDT